MINSDAYTDEKFRFISMQDPRQHDYQEWNRVIERHMWEWLCEVYNKHERHNQLIQHATFHDLVAPMIDSNPQHLVYGPSLKIRDEDLPTFCKRYHLDEQQIRLVSDGKLHSHKGFTRGTHIGIAYHGHLYRPVTPVDPAEVIRRERSVKQEAQRVEDVKYTVPVSGEHITFDPANPPELPTEKASNNVLVSLKGLFN